MPSVAVSEPFAATVQRSLCPLPFRSDQNAIRAPCGDQDGCKARTFPTIRFLPVASSTAQRPSPGPPTESGEKKVLVETAISRPSGDQVGLKPKSVKRLTDSPVGLIRKMPPPSRTERDPFAVGREGGLPVVGGRTGGQQRRFAPADSQQVQPQVAVRLGDIDD